MEIRKIAGSQPASIETPSPAEQQKRRIQRGIAAGSDSFESAPLTNSMFNETPARLQQPETSDVAAALSSMAGVAGEIPITGQIIAASLSTIASVITIVEQIAQKKAEEEAKKKNAAAQSNDQSSAPNDPRNEAKGESADATLKSGRH